MNGITLTPIGYRPCYSPGLYGPVGATYRSAKKTTRARTPELPMTTTLKLMTHAEGDWASRQQQEQQHALPEGNFRMPGFAS